MASVSRDGHSTPVSTSSVMALCLSVNKITATDVVEFG